jgi:hypothetical protein
MQMKVIDSSCRLCQAHEHFQPAEDAVEERLSKVVSSVDTQRESSRKQSC